MVQMCLKTLFSLLLTMWMELKSLPQAPLSILASRAGDYGSNQGLISTRIFLLTFYYYLFMVTCLFCFAVVGSWKLPVPGWHDNYNGPIGLMIAAGKGVVRTVISKTEKDSIFDCIPVDTVVKMMCIAAWLKANSR